MAVYQGKAFVTFIDLLGFSARLRETWGSDSGALKTLLSIKKEFSEYQPLKLGMVGEFGEPLAAVGKAEFSLFSDSILLFSRSMFHQNPADFDSALMTILTAAGDVIRMVANHGFGVRGGVEFGDVWWDGTELIGPAFLDAYTIETKVKSARIAVGCGVLDHVAKRLPNPYLSEWLYTCSDGVMAVRPLNAGDAIADLRATAPDNFKSRYNELIENLPPVGSQNWGPAPFTSAAQALRALLAK